MDVLGRVGTHHRKVTDTVDGMLKCPSSQSTILSIFSVNATQENLHCGLN
jgi:hypothetical protein